MVQFQIKLLSFIDEQSDSIIGLIIKHYSQSLLSCLLSIDLEAALVGTIIIVKLLAAEMGFKQELEIFFSLFIFLFLE